MSGIVKINNTSTPSESPPPEGQMGHRRVTVLSSKSSCYWVKFALFKLGQKLVPFLFGLLSLIPLMAPAIFRVISYFNKRAYRNKVEEKIIKHMASSLTEFPLSLEALVRGRPKLEGSQNPPKIEQFVDYYQEVVSIQDELEQLSHQTPSFGSAHQLYQRIQALFDRDSRFGAVYQAIKDTKDPALRFLRDLALKFRTADGREVVKEIGRATFGKVKPNQTGGYSIDQIAEVNQKELGSLFGFHRDSTVGKILWAVTHPLDLLHSGESSWFPENYDAHYSNPSYVVHKGNFEGTSYSMIAGPTPSNDPAYYEGSLQVSKEIRINNMDTHKKAEHGWIAKLDKAADTSGQRLKHLVMGFDAKFKTKALKGLRGTRSVDNLIDGYKAFLLDASSRQIEAYKKDNGVCIPESILTDKEIELVCEESKKLFESLGQTAVSNRRAILLGVDTMIELAVIIKHFRDIKSAPAGENLISVACKQCYDRGPVYLAALRIFLRSLETEALLSEDEFFEIAGLFPSRAPLGEGRNLQEKRHDIFMPFAEMIGDKTAILSKHTNSLKAQLLQSR